jgi:hypothetical protein
MTSQHPHDPFRPVTDDDVPPHAPPEPNLEPEQTPQPDPSPESEPKPKRRRRSKKADEAEATEDELAAALAELDGKE